MASTSRALEDSQLDDLVDLIRNSFRVRPNHDPVYVDVGENMNRISAPQHQVVYGRRGSGKSCLLVYFHRNIAKTERILSIYIDCDEIKRLSYPDLLVRLLLNILEKLMSTPRPRWKFWAKASLVEAAVADLRAILDLAEDVDVTEEVRSADAEKLEASLNLPKLPTVGATVTSEVTRGRTSAFHERKLVSIERHLQDYKDALIEALNASSFKHGALILDDFYLVHPTVQPDVIDYLHRLVRGTNLYLKVGTVRHRTSLVRIADQTVGVEEHQDIEEINLDRTFEDTTATQEYLQLMLDTMGKKQGIEAASQRYLSQDGRLALTLASGGVPRDYLTVFVEAVEAARAIRKTKWLTPTTVYKGAGRVSYRTKLTHLREDTGLDATPLERLFQDLLAFCLSEKRKTAFLVSQSEVAQHSDQHELVQQLMDFKLIHVIESDTSAASRRSGRYEAYTLDFALFMEPRLRGIEHVEFWRFDEQSRRSGVREAPVYALERASSLINDIDTVQADTVQSTEDVFGAIQADIGVDDTSQRDASP